jgi:hypothetical protein
MISPQTGVIQMTIKTDPRRLPVPLEQPARALLEVLRDAHPEKRIRARDGRERWSHRFRLRPKGPFG